MEAHTSISLVENGLHNNTARLNGGVLSAVTVNITNEKLVKAVVDGRVMFVKQTGMVMTK